MGLPMARNLARGDVPVVVWNRTPARCAEVDAERADDPADLFARSDVVLLMLADESATDAVLDRHGPGFGQRVRGRTVVQMGTVSAGYSRALDADVTAHGGAYVEAPVSGSRGPAEAGTLVAMIAGRDEDVRRVTPLLGPMCAEVVECGPVPGGALMKFAVNVFLITTMVGLAEAFGFAESTGLDPAVLRRILDAGPIASTVSRTKAAKIVDGDHSVQAAAADVFKNTRLIVEAAREAGAASPLLDVCDALMADTVAHGRGGDDVVAVLDAIRRHRTHPGGGRETEGAAEHPGEVALVGEPGGQRGVGG